MKLTLFLSYSLLPFWQASFQIPHPCSVAQWNTTPGFSGTSQLNLNNNATGFKCCSKLLLPPHHKGGEAQDGGTPRIKLKALKRKDLGSATKPCQREPHRYSLEGPQVSEWMQELRTFKNKMRGRPAFVQPMTSLLLEPKRWHFPSSPEWGCAPGDRGACNGKIVRWGLSGDTDRLCREQWHDRGGLLDKGALPSIEG